jgi:hypothetical protein
MCSFGGVGIRTASRLTGVNRSTVGSLALRVGLGCMELHERIMVGIRTERLALDEACLRAAFPTKSSVLANADPETDGKTCVSSAAASCGQPR